MRENQHPGLADGFVMGEGGVVFLLKRLEDAERDGDRIYAVVRGLAGASDGKGKGIRRTRSASGSRWSVPGGRRACHRRPSG